MRLRAEQVGSLLRPPDLLAARAAYAEGRLDRADLRAKEDAAITKAIQRQREIGMDVFADGELERDFTYVDDIIEGVRRVIDRVPTPNPAWDPAASTPAQSDAPLPR